MADITKYTWEQLKAEFSFVADVFEQPAAIDSFVKFYTGKEGREMLRGLRQEWTEAQYDRVYMAGMGSSSFAGHLAWMIFTEHGIPCNLIDAGELLYYGLNIENPQTPLVNHKTLFILISQSGESAEVAKLVEEITSSRGKAGVWGVTNTEGSSLAKKAGRALFLKAGEERSVTAKTYCNTLLMMYILPRVIMASSDADAGEFLDTFLDEARDLIADLEHLLSKQQDLGDKIVAFFGKDTKHVEIIARGTSMATAQQAALNIKETDKISAEAISGGQFRHGPIEIVTKDFRSMILSSDDDTRDLAEDIAWNIAHRWGGGKVLYITNRKSERLEGEPRVLPVVHGISNPFLATIMEIAVIQLFMIKLAVANNIGPGVFKYTSKVTKEG
nr:SIS domain-containing protein [Candidatus Sigynarchaeota archaeon]